MKKEFNNRCEVVLNLLSGKWKAHILYFLTKGPARTSELKRLVTGISQKMLTEQLKELERDGLVARKVFNQIPPKVEYSLTEHGSSLTKVLGEIVEWTENYVEQRHPDGEVVFHDNDDGL
ncbi:winged helix-turn-helix transcriptional regulator [Paenibacillus agilis]|uniref:Winged helix-turn-helix transcriptional regulator n=1 Tax=Paenibacillus agilis TaxID=3020863 RepID=A0A559IYW9_9BACL|nr:winged helix-turn-helix transcriptional regulator [Paenibacillus agilis]TVX92808.1 winged helix-turn-helix transcriptional regulator [Paenibacillus agilis]